MAALSKGALEPSTAGDGDVLHLRTLTADSSGTENAYTVLVVDDCVALTNAMAHRLACDGFAVWTAHCIADARRVCAERCFDLVLVDLSLPDGSGLEIASYVRQCNSLSTVAVMSGYPLSRRSKRVRDCVDAVLIKPWRNSDLQQVLDLAKRRRVDSGNASLADVQ